MAAAIVAAFVEAFATGTWVGLVRVGPSPVTVPAFAPPSNVQSSPFTVGFFPGIGHVVLLKANVRSKGGPQPADHRGNVGHGRLAEPKGLSEILHIGT